MISRRGSPLVVSLGLALLMAATVDAESLETVVSRTTLASYSIDPGAGGATRNDSDERSTNEMGAYDESSQAMDSFDGFTAETSATMDSALQAWDGIFSFTYSHSTDFEPRRLSGFFDIKGDPQKLAHSIACAAIFLRGDVAAADKSVLAPLSKQGEREKLYETFDPWQISTPQFGVDANTALQHRIAMRLTDEGGLPKPATAEDAKAFVSDTGQIRWDVSHHGAGYFVVDTPHTKLFTGFVAGRTFELGQVKLKIGKTRLDWATVSIVSLNPKPARPPERVLIAATGWVQNRDAEIERLPNNRITLRSRWGNEPVLCEGIPAEITLPVPAERVTLFPLDESGNRREPIECHELNGQAVLPLAAKHKTIWYEVEVR